MINLLRKGLLMRLLIGTIKILALLAIIVSVSFVYYGKKVKNTNDIVYKAISVYEMVRPLEFARRTETKAFEFSIYAEVDKKYFKSRSSVEVGVLVKLLKKDNSVSEKRIELKFRVSDLNYEYSDKIVKSNDKKIVLGPKRFFVYDKDLLNVKSVILDSLSGEEISLLVRPFSVRINAKHESDKSWARLKPESKEEFEALSIVPDGVEKHKERLSYAITQKNSISPEGATTKKKIEVAQKDNFDAKNYVYVSRRKKIWFSLEADSMIRITPSVYSEKRLIKINKVEKGISVYSRSIDYNRTIKLEKGIYSLQAIGRPAFIHVLKKGGENLSSPFITTKFYYSDKKEISYQFSDKNYPLSRLRLSFPAAPEQCSLKVSTVVEERETVKNIKFKPVVNTGLKYKTFYKIDLSYENIFYFNQRISRLKVNSDCDFVIRVEEALSDKSSNLFLFSKWQEVKPIEFSKWPTEFMTYQIVESEEINNFNFSSFYSLKSEEQSLSGYILNVFEVNEEEDLPLNNFVLHNINHPVSKDMKFFLHQCRKNSYGFNSEKLYKLDDFEGVVSLSEINRLCDIYVTSKIIPGFKLSKYEIMNDSLTYVYSFNSLFHRVKAKILIPTTVKRYPIKLRFSFEYSKTKNLMISVKPHRSQRNFIISESQLLPYNDKYSYIETILPFAYPIKESDSVVLKVSADSLEQPLLIRSVFNGDYASNYELKAWSQVESGQRPINIKDLKSRHKADTFRIEDLFDDIMF